MSRSETARYNVTTDQPDAAHRVNAAYYQHEEDFTVFKGEDGGILASFANDHIVAIEREVTAVSGETTTPNVKWTISPSRCPNCTPLMNGTNGPAK